jgi:L-fuculose-phosphate aldolase
MLDIACDVLKESYKRNWITSLDGNFSFKRSGEKHMYVTPSGVRKHLLSEELLIKISIPDLSRKWFESPDQKFCKGLLPTGELPMHHNLQKDYDGCRFVLHLHPTYTIAAMKKGVYLSSLSKEFPELKRYTRVGPNVPAIEPVSLELSKAVCSAFNIKNNGIIDYDIIGLDRHGIVSIASDPWSAFEHVERLEHICKIHLI